MKTDTAQLKKANWNKLRTKVNDRIDVLEQMVSEMEPTPGNDKICQELIVPALSKLADFVTRIEIHESKLN